MALFGGGDGGGGSGFFGLIFALVLPLVLGKLLGGGGAKVPKLPSLPTPEPLVNPDDALGQEATRIRSLKRRRGAGQEANLLSVESPTPVSSKTLLGE